MPKELTKNPQLTPRQTRFCEEYVIDLNGTQAAIRAGYRETTAAEQASRLLTLPKVDAYVAELKAARSERTKVDSDFVLEELAKIARFDVRKLFKDDGSLKAIKDIDDETAAGLASLEVVEMEGGMSLNDGLPEHKAMYTKKVRPSDRIAALTLLGRHLGLWNDKIKVEGLGELADRLQRARSRVKSQQ